MGETSAFARRQRHNSTWAAKLLWRWLRHRRFCGYKFRREHVVGKYCLDFYCPEARLSIELDGSQHGHPQRRAYDFQRTTFLQSLGIQELRFWNAQLVRQRQFVRDVIFNALQQRAPHPLPAYTRPGLVAPAKPPDQAPSQREDKRSPSPLPSPPGRG